MEPESADEWEVPFGEPESPARRAWRKLFGEAPPPTPAEVEAWRYEFDAALERACPLIASGQVQPLLAILQDCPGLAQSLHGDALLRYAIECDRYDVLDALLCVGIRQDRIDENGTTPLMDAAAAGRLEMVCRLLQAGADPNVLPEDHDRKIDREFYGEGHFFFALCRDDRALVALLSAVTRPKVRERAAASGPFPMAAIGERAGRRRKGRVEASAVP